MLKSFFKPEFINRLDEVIVFKPLLQEHIKKIADIQIKRLQKRLQNKQIGLTLDDKAKEYIAVNGYDAEFGARPLKRLIENEIENPLAMMILDGRVKEGGNVKITSDSSKLILQ